MGLCVERTPDISSAPLGRLPLAAESKWKTNEAAGPMGLCRSPNKPRPQGESGRVRAHGPPQAPPGQQVGGALLGRTLGPALGTSHRGGLPLAQDTGGLGGSCPQEDPTSPRGSHPTLKLGNESNTYYT